MVDALLKYEPYMREFTGVPQAGRASDAVAAALDDPSLANITNTGAQTGMAVLRPGMALGALGLGLGAAAARDSGGSPVATAEAQGLTRTQKREMEMERQRVERQGAMDQKAAETASRLKREEADASAKRDLETKAKSNERAEYDRAVSRSEEAYKREMDRDWRFDESNVGKVWRATGGLGPALAGFGLGKLSRAASGPGEGTLGKVLKDYAAPIAAGGVGGAISANLPLVGEALYAPSYNPKRAAYEARAEELPPSHPRRNEYLEYAKGLPEKNPVRKNASDEFYDPEKLKERMLIGGVEGASGGLAASDLINALARLAKGSGERSAAIAGRQGPTQPGGPVIDAAPNATAGARAEPSLANILSEQKALPPPAGSSASLPPQLDSPANRNFAGPQHHANYQPRTKDGTRFKKGKPQYPDEP